MKNKLLPRLRRHSNVNGPLASYKPLIELHVLNHQAEDSWGATSCTASVETKRKASFAIQSEVEKGWFLIEELILPSSVQSQLTAIAGQRRTHRPCQVNEHLWKSWSNASLLEHQHLQWQKHVLSL